MPRTPDATPAVNSATMRAFVHWMRAAAPYVHAFRGKEFVEYDNPYDVGMTGLLGFSSGYRAMEQCDALLMLGTDFPYRTSLDHVKGLMNMGFSMSDLTAIESRNAQRLLNRG